MAVHPWKSVQNMLRHRPIFLVAVISGLAITTLAAQVLHLKQITADLVGWNAGVWMYLILWLYTFWHAESDNIQHIAKKLDESKWIILLVVIAAIGMCLFAIIGELGHAPKDERLQLFHTILSVSTLISSWLLMHTIFAIHYAHDFYNNLSKGQDGGLDFPKTETPTYRDFIYFSFIIGTSAQTADVSITEPNFRMLNIAHCCLAFAFNTSILAIMINMVANTIGG